jgi:hypothetical protein
VLVLVVVHLLRAGVCISRQGRGRDKAGTRQGQGSGKARRDKAGTRQRQGNRKAGARLGQGRGGRKLNEITPKNYWVLFWGVVFI